MKQRARKNKRHSQHHWREQLGRMLSPRTFLQRHAQVAVEDAEFVASRQSQLVKVGAVHDHMIRFACSRVTEVRETICIALKYIGFKVVSPGYGTIRLTRRVSPSMSSKK